MKTDGKCFCIHLVMICLSDGKRLLLPILNCDRRYRHLEEGKVKFAFFGETGGEKKGQAEH